MFRVCTEWWLIWSAYQQIVSYQLSHFLPGCTLVHRNPFISFTPENLHTHPTKHTPLISWKCLMKWDQRVRLPVSFPLWELRMNRAHSIIKWQSYDLLMSLMFVSVGQTCPVWRAHHRSCADTCTVEQLNQPWHLIWVIHEKLLWFIHRRPKLCPSQPKQIRTVCPKNSLLFMLICRVFFNL